MLFTFHRRGNENEHANKSTRVNLLLLYVRNNVLGLLYGTDLECAGLREVRK